MVVVVVDCIINFRLERESAREAMVYVRRKKRRELFRQCGERA